MLHGSRSCERCGTKLPIIGARICVQGVPALRPILRYQIYAGLSMVIIGASVAMLGPEMFDVISRPWVHWCSLISYHFT